MFRIFYQSWLDIHQPVGRSTLGGSPSAQVQHCGF
uniref:Uncharacterized protein n=1 Tax=Anguilla anguilla TaxID=7936 RepID=A0A0E9TU75_ANGAN